MWFAVPWAAADGVPLSLYLALVTAGLTVLWRVAGERADGVFHRTAFIAVMLALFGLVRMAGYDAYALSVLAAFAGFFVWFARRHQDFADLVAAAAVLVLAILATWHLPYVMNADYYGGLMMAPVVPPELTAFLVTGGAFGLFFLAIGVIAVPGAQTPFLWAALATAQPLVTLIIAYWRVEARGVDLYWAAVGLALAAVNLAVVRMIVARRAAPGMNDALAIFTLGVFGALAFGATMLLDQAWLTVALAALVAAAAWVERSFAVAHMRKLALILGAVVLIRFVNIDQWRQLPDGLSGILWLAYGYLLPAVAFFAAKRWFAPTRIDRTVLAMRVLSGFAVLSFVSLSLRLGVGGGIYAAYTLLEAALQTLAWGIGALRLLGWLIKETEDRLVEWGWRLLAGLALANLILFQLGLFNPMLTGDPVGRWPLVNLISLAYGLAAVLAALIAWLASRRDLPWVAIGGWVLALILVFVDLNLEVRHAFHGTVLTIGRTGVSEWMAYSLTWLAYGGVLMAAGLFWKQAALRHAALVIVLLTVCKVFLFDMAALSGLYRVLSFLGLGLSLVAIGFLYQRFVLTRGSGGAAATRRS